MASGTICCDELHIKLIIDTKKFKVGAIRQNILISLTLNYKWINRNRVTILTCQYFVTIVSSGYYFILFRHSHSFDNDSEISFMLRWSNKTQISYLSCLICVSVLSNLEPRLFERFSNMGVAKNFSGLLFMMTVCKLTTNIYL